MGKSKTLAAFILASVVVFAAAFCFAWAKHAEAQSLPVPRLSIGIDTAQKPEEVSQSLQILLLITLLSLAPAILIMMTSFTRIIVVLSFMRSALATQQMPPNQVLIGLALFLTFFVMAPTWQAVNRDALQPYLKGEITQEEAYKRGMEHIRTFMFKQTRENDLALFVSLAHLPRPHDYNDIPNYVLIP
ncbi:MAG: flagellar type III secretion system pore protein FliP, partial [Thermacetogeniaceae bacterium]